MSELRILWVKVGGLWPLTSGGRIRSFHTIANLSRLHEVSVLTTHARDEDARELQAQLPQCSRVVSIPHAASKRDTVRFAGALARSWFSPWPVDLWRWRPSGFRAAVAAALADGDFDVCVADFLVASANLPPAMRTPTLLFEHNVEHMIWERLERTVGPVQRRLVKREARKLRRFETLACTRAQLTAAVSETDRALLAKIAPEARVRSIPTGVDLSYFTPDGTAETPGRLVFVGAMDWYPNEDAALHLIEAILPLIRGEQPDVSLCIVGRNPSARVLAAAAAAGVEVTGTVDDVRPHIAEATVLVVPIRVGGGTRLKIFEALAMAKAVVSTTIGAEGLPLTDGEHLLLADHPSDFASSVVQLLRDPGRRIRIGAAGRTLVSERYSWERVAAKFAELCTEAAGGTLS